ncbi:uncharacterized protein LOC117109160 [Anneissia japonica]|uniref:uncharacterized protein LOC117109160 n=1 Tax=Anneissia japonica TaxID=1529436 RepID=UPI001425A2D2|nr:uncharacterized protein LOC117109160 [Anneissia japonica]
MLCGRVGIYIAVFCIFISADTSTCSHFADNNGFELVSEFKEATQSSNHGPGVADRAVDGGRNGNYFAHSCTHTAGGLNNPWWYVDLGASTVVSKIVIYNRDECCGERLTGAVVSVGNDKTSPFTGNTQCGPTVTQTMTYRRPIIMRCNPPIAGQYVSVYLHGSEPLSLCEVEVYKDISNPVLKCPEDIVVSASLNQSIIPVTWSNPTVMDNIDSGLMAICTPASGSLFEIGFTKVNCSATDVSENAGHCSFVVNVADDEEPTLECPQHIIVNNSVDQSEKPVTWKEPTVTDNVHIGMSASCTPASGSVFDVGSTIVTCSATDGASNEGSCSFVVHVEGQEFPSYLDEEEPVILCPANILVNSGVDQSSNPVTWSEPTVTDNVITGLSATCTPESGSVFDVGSTIVTCSATDGAGNEGSCLFVVHVTGQINTAAKIHSGNKTDNSGYLIAVVILGVMLLVLTSTFVIVCRYYKRMCIRDRDKHQYSFIAFDVVEFYPSISMNLLNDALDFASRHDNITEEEREIIFPY